MPNKSILSVVVTPSDILYLLKPAFHCAQFLQILANTNCRKCGRYKANPTHVVLMDEN